MEKKCNGVEAVLDPPLIIAMPLETIFVLARGEEQPEGLLCPLEFFPAPCLSMMLKGGKA